MVKSPPGDRTAMTGGFLNSSALEGALTRTHVALTRRNPDRMATSRVSQHGPTANPYAGREGARLILRGKSCELLLPKRRAGNSPPSLGSLREQDPCAARLTRIARDPGDDLGRLGDELLLPGPREHARRRDYLHADGPCRTLRCSVHGRGRHPMNVRAGVVGMRRARPGNSLGLQERGGQLLGELAIGADGKEVGRSVDVDHRHGSGPPMAQYFSAAAKSLRLKSASRAVLRPPRCVSGLSAPRGRSARPLLKGTASKSAICSPCCSR